MRFDGTLTKWNDQRGFGFVAPTQGGQEVFIHISSFPRDGRRPRLHEPVSFEIELDKKGQKRAIHVLRSAGSQSSSRRSTQAQSPRQAASFLVKLVTIVLLAAVGVYGYSRYSKRASAYVSAETRESTERHAAQARQPLLTNQRCDGRLHCSQMTSCAEAAFFLKNCPGVQMDGNHDGVPCQQQWCTGLFAN